MSANAVFLCGPAKGKDGAMRCPCCGMESKNPDAFAVSLCWPCGFGINLDCKQCRTNGVWVDRFSSKKGRGHRFARWSPGGHYALTTCGQRIPRKDIGQATAVRDACRHCWERPE